LAIVLSVFWPLCCLSSNGVLSDLTRHDISVKRRIWEIWF